MVLLEFIMNQITIISIAVILFSVGVISLLTQPTFYQVGIASWYGPKFQGKVTASGEVYNMYELTAAHKSLPFGTRVCVVDLETKKRVAVTINDRGPFIKNRIIDLSYRAAKKLGIIDKGITKVGLIILKDNQSC